MRDLIVSEFISVDGVVEAPGGEPTHPHTGWAIPYHSEGLVDFKLRETLEAGSLLLGRTTYESFVEAWPERDGPFAEKMNTMPKHVVTSRPGLAWNASAITGDVPAAVAELKEQDGGPILVVGSAMLARTLLAAGLVDDLRLLVFPVVVGGGLSIWPDDRGRQDLALTETATHDHGVQLQIYRPRPTPEMPEQD